MASKTECGTNCESLASLVFHPVGILAEHVGFRGGSESLLPPALLPLLLGLADGGVHWAPGDTVFKLRA